MRRRKFISLLAGMVVVSWPRGVKAQGAARRPMVAVLVPGSQESSQEYVNVFLQVLREQGRIDGQTIDIKYRYADGDASRHPALAQELVRLNPDVIVAGSTTPALACKQATATIPIVSAVLTDAIDLGLITSIARPGGNVTGIMGLEGMPGKQLQLLLEMVPDLTRIGLIVTVNEKASGMFRQNAEAAAAAMGVTLVPVEVRTPEDIEGAFQALTQARVKAVHVLGSQLVLSARREFTARALAARLPTVFSTLEPVEAGGLMAYGTHFGERWRRVAYLVEQILKGTKPADLPVEILTKHELVINFSTARALGISIPPSIITRADRVIE